MFRKADIFNEKGFEAIQVLACIALAVVLLGSLIVWGVGNAEENAGKSDEIIGSMYDNPTAITNNSGTNIGVISPGSGTSDYAPMASFQILRAKLLALEGFKTELDSGITELAPKIPGIEDKVRQAVEIVESLKEKADKLKELKGKGQQIVDTAEDISNTGLDIQKQADELSYKVESIKTGVKEAYSHAKEGNRHYITGAAVTEGEIVFVSTAAYREGDEFYLNGQKVSAIRKDGKDLIDSFFVGNVYVTCYIMNNYLYFQ